MSATILNELEFCKQQIKKFSDLYDMLLMKYCNSMADVAPVKKTMGKNARKQVIALESESSSSSSESEYENDLANEIVNFISRDEPATNKRSAVAVVDEDPVESNRKSIQNSVKEDETDFKRIEQKKYDARAGVREHEDKLSKIYAEEKRLLSLGMDAESVRKRVREQFYPEAIPANERRSPKIYMKAPGADGLLKNKTVNLLAFDEDYLEDDNPELTKQQVDRHTGQQVIKQEPSMDLPTINEEESSFTKKIQALLDDDDDDSENIVDETPL